MLMYIVGKEVHSVCCSKDQVDIGFQLDSQLIHSDLICCTFEVEKGHFLYVACQISYTGNEVPGSGAVHISLGLTVSTHKR